MCSEFTDGVTRQVYLINGQQPGPLIEADEGDDLEIFVNNELPVETTVHWHGQYAQQYQSRTQTLPVVTKTQSRSLTMR